LSQGLASYLSEMEPFQGFGWVLEGLREALVTVGRWHVVCSP
jgi:hypothetical protein